MVSRSTMPTGERVPGILHDGSSGRRALPAITRRGGTVRAAKELDGELSTDGCDGRRGLIDIVHRPAQLAIRRWMRAFSVSRRRRASSGENSAPHESHR